MFKVAARRRVERRKRRDVAGSQEIEEKKGGAPRKLEKEEGSSTDRSISWHWSRGVVLVDWPHVRRRHVVGTAVTRESWC